MRVGYLISSSKYVLYRAVTGRRCTLMLRC